MVASDSTEGTKMKDFKIISILFNILYISNFETWYLQSLTLKHKLCIKKFLKNKSEALNHI